jgi:precorrin-2/cobalt-factor-2 C20-methyltransferase
MYLFARLGTRFPVEIVPGVTSLTACAAALKRPLTSRNDVLTVLPGPLADAELRARIEAAQAIAIIKVGRHLDRIRALLEAMGLTANAGYIERASLGAEHVRTLSEAPEKAPYFSMILIYKGDDPWLR